MDYYRIVGYCKLLAVLERSNRTHNMIKEKYTWDLLLESMPVWEVGSVWGGGEGS